MFQIGFGATPFAAGVMLLVYMAGNLAMKSVTTPIVHRFGFRDVMRWKRRVSRLPADAGAHLSKRSSVGPAAVRSATPRGRVVPAADGCRSDRRETR